MRFTMNPIFPSAFGPGRRGHAGLRRASTLLMTLVYMIMFASLASSMVAFSQANMAVEQGENDADQALIAAESGMSFLVLQFKSVGMPAIREGNIMTMATPSQLWSGTKVESVAGTTANPNNNGIAVQLAASFNSDQAISTTITAPSGTGTLNVPPIKVDSVNSTASYTLSVAWDTSGSSNPGPQQVPIANTNPQQYTSYPGVLVLDCKSVGTCGNVSRTVSMQVWIQKTLKYAVYSNVAIQLGKNVRVVGDIASTYTGTNKGPPVQMFSDFHYLPNESQMETDLANLRGLLNTYDNTYTNRISVANSVAVAAAAKDGISDLNGDGYIDDMDIALKNLDANHDGQISSGEFTNPSTGKSYDSDLFTVIDDPEGPVSGGTLPNGSLPLWYGYGDGTINNLDGYAKVNGTVQMGLSYASWQAAASGWSDWGDTNGGTPGTDFRDQFEGPVVSTDPTQSPVQFSVNFSNQQTLVPTDFDTSTYDAAPYVPTGNATKSGSTISNGTISSAQANDGTVTEHTPADATSGWQATYTRPVFQNITFNNVRIPKGLNAKFINCTFNGYTSVEMNATITKGGTVKSNGTITGGTTVTDPTDGMTYAQTMITGTFNANTALTATNSVAFTQGNNLHFSGCTFNGPISASDPTAYTHFADSMEFDGVTNFNNTTDPTFTILAPNTNIEMGSFQNPGGNPSTLTGVVVAGNIDIRGSATMDGSIIVTGAGAENTTLGYFGSTDSGQAVPPQSQLPTEANGSYGHLYFKINPSRGMPNGIAIPVLVSPQYGTYQTDPVSGS